MVGLRAGPIRQYSRRCRNCGQPSGGIDALLILIPLLGMTYFLFDPEAFNAFLAWLARIL
jgi:hypothetical protein